MSDNNRAVFITLIIVGGCLTWVLFSTIMEAINHRGDRNHVAYMRYLELTHGTGDSMPTMPDQPTDLGVIAVDPVTDVDLTQNGRFPGRQS